MVLETLARRMTAEVTDEQLKRNLFTYLYFAFSGSFKAVQDLLSFVHTKGVAEVLQRSPKEYQQFVDTVVEMQVTASDTE